MKGETHPRAARLVILRHGPAASVDPVRWPDDRERPLATAERPELKRAVRGLAALTGGADRIATSGALRARATAEAFRDELGAPPRLDDWPELLPGGPAEPVLGRFARSARAGLLQVVVGHAPTLSELVGLSVLGEAVPIVHLARGGAACVEFPLDVRPGAGTLLWLLTRKQLGAVRA